MLSYRDHEIIQQCLRASAEGPFFPDEEFSTLFGFSRDTFREVIKGYEPEDDMPVHEGIAVHNALNNLLGYPIDSPDEWHQWISASRDEVTGVLQRWMAHYDYE